MSVILDLVEQGKVPDLLVRWAIRRLLVRRLREEGDNPDTMPQQRLHDFVTQLRKSPIALHPEKANEQHYELPPTFFQHVLGISFAPLRGQR